MAQEINLKQIERKAWISFFEDGLLDILMGLLLLLMVVPNMLSDVFPSKSWQYGTTVALAGLAVVIFWAGKRFITMPRLGRVQFSRAEGARHEGCSTYHGCFIIHWNPHGERVAGAEKGCICVGRRGRVKSAGAAGTCGVDHTDL